MGKLFEELKRRKVFRVAAMYAVVAWLLIQVVDVVLPTFGAPEWANQTVIFLLMLGFPISLLLAWVFDIGPGGIVRSDSTEASTETRHPDRSFKFNIIVIATLALAIGLMVFRQSGYDSQVEPQVVDETVTTPSIAVLAFTNMSANSDNEYFSDGISEEILNVLENRGGLEIASRTSAFAFKNENRNIIDIADILDVQYILEGSVRASGDDLRITAQLIDAQRDVHLWSESYDRNLTLDSIFAIQDDIAGRVVSSLGNVIGNSQEPIPTVSVSTDDLDAYDLYLRARAQSSIFSQGSVATRIELLNEAVRRDPNFAEAWAMLSENFLGLPTWDFSLDIEEYNMKALEAAERALTLDPDSQVALVSLGQIADSRYQWEEADRYYEQAYNSFMSARELSVGYLSRSILVANEEINRDAERNFPHLIKGLALLSLERIEEAEIEINRAMELGYMGISEQPLNEYYRRNGNPAWATAFARRRMEQTHPEMMPLLPAINRLLSSPPNARISEIDRFWVEANELGLSRDKLLDLSSMPTNYYLAQALGEYQALVDFFWGNMPMFWMWEPGLKEFRQSEPFKNQAHATGLFDYWRNRGWPDLCAPIGSDDFECD